MAPAMPCKTCEKSKHGETRGKTFEFKLKLACILEASESTRMRGQGEGVPQGMRMDRDGGGTREGPEPACVQTPYLLGWHTRSGGDRMN